MSIETLVSIVSAIVVMVVLGGIMAMMATKLEEKIESKAAQSFSQYEGAMAARTRIAERLESVEGLVAPPGEYLVGVWCRVQMPAERFGTNTAEELLKRRVETTVSRVVTVPVTQSHHYVEVDFMLHTPCKLREVRLFGDGWFIRDVKVGNRSLTPGSDGAGPALFCNEIVEVGNLVRVTVEPPGDVRSFRRFAPRC